jgi:hypothetical protein
MRDVDPTGQRVTGPVRVLTQVKEKISKYDLFLQNNKTELENRDLAASINQEQRGPIQPRGQVIRPGAQMQQRQEMERPYEEQERVFHTDQSSIQRKEETIESDVPERKGYEANPRG